MKKYYFSLILFLLGVVSLSLRLHQMVDSSLNLDEMVSLQMAKDLGLKNFFWDNHPPFSLLFLKMSCFLFGLNEYGARFSSAVFSTATSLIIGLTLWRQKAPTWAVVIGVLLHAFFPLSIEYGQQARPYALFELASAVQFMTFLDFLKDKTKRTALLASSFVVFISSYLATLLFVFEWAFMPRKSRSLLSIVGFNLMLLLLIIGSKNIIDWRYLDWQLVAFNMNTYAFLPIEIVKAFSFQSMISGIGISFLLMIFLLNMDQDRANNAVGTTLLFLSFVLVLIGFSLVTSRAIFAPRYFLFLSPMFVFGFVSLLEKAKLSGKANFLRFACLSLVLTGAVQTVRGLYPFQQPRWREAADMVASSPSSIVLTMSHLALQVPYFDERNIKVEPILGARQLVDQIEILLKTYERVWIVDSVWNTMRYIPEILPTLNSQKGLRIEDFTEVNEGGLGVTVLRIEHVTQ